MTVKYQPTGSNVLIKPENDSKTTEGGIALPDSFRGSTRNGLVIAVGPGVYQIGQLNPVSVKVGDLVIYQSRGKNPVEIEECVLVDESDILARRV